MVGGLLRIVAPGRATTMLLPEVTHAAAYSENCRVLIVEDEYFLADDLAQALRASGAAIVGPVGTVNEAIEQLGGGDVDAAILDIRLWDETTYSLAEQLIRKEIPVVFTTGYGAEAVPVHFRHIERWQKPIDVEELVSHLADLCQEMHSVAE